MFPSENDWISSAYVFWQSEFTKTSQSDILAVRNTGPRYVNYTQGGGLQNVYNRKLPSVLNIVYLSTKFPRKGSLVLGRPLIFLSPEYWDFSRFFQNFTVNSVESAGT